MSMSETVSLSAGMNVLVVEDEMLIAMLLEDMLTDMGHVVVGPASDIEAALAHLKEGGIDAAILDVNLGKTPSWPVAAALQEQGVPFAFATGYGEAGVDARYADTPTLQKPFKLEALVDILKSISPSSTAA